MRFLITFLLKEKEMPSDYRRKFISFLKKSFESYDKDIFNKYYRDKDPIEKPYTFSVYLGKALFSKDKVILEKNKIHFTFSTIDMETGLHFYNAVLGMKGKEFYIEKNNSMLLEEIRLIQEEAIIKERVIFHTISPILIREHNKETNKDWYYSFEDEESISILKRNMKYQAVKYFGKDAEYDVEQMDIIPLNVKKLVINHYGVFVTGNAGSFELRGKPYLLDYFYKSGVASKKSEGFGLCNLVG